MLTSAVPLLAHAAVGLAALRGQSAGDEGLESAQLKADIAGANTLIANLLNLNGFSDVRLDGQCGATENGHAGCDPTGWTPCCEKGKCVAASECATGHDHANLHRCSGKALTSDHIHPCNYDACAIHTKWHCVETVRGRDAATEEVSMDSDSLNTLAEALGENEAPHDVHEMRLLLLYRYESCFFQENCLRITAFSIYIHSTTP